MLPLVRLVRPRPSRVFDSETVWLSLVVAGIGAIRVALALADHESFSAEPTIALILVVLGLVGAATSLRPRRPR